MDSFLMQSTVKAYRNFRDQECREFNEKSIVQQWKEQVNAATSKVTGLVVRLAKGDMVRFDKSFIGDIKKRINTRKKMTLGEIGNDISILQQHYQWIRNLETEILTTKEVPLWLR